MSSSTPPPAEAPVLEIIQETTEIKAEKRSRSPSPGRKSVIETRRAEQNRAAQRAFRQRKERYVKELEAKVNSMAEWPARMEHLEQENKHLNQKIHDLLQQMEDNRKKMFVTPPYPRSPPTATSPSNINNNNSNNNDSSNSSNTVEKTVVAGEKGRVLDDLVSILRTRHRPPIPSHPPN